MYRAAAYLPMAPTHAIELQTGTGRRTDMLDYNYKSAAIASKKADTQRYEITTIIGHGRELKLRS